MKDELEALRDEAHRLSQEKLASGDADKASLERARELRSRLDSLIAANDSADVRVQQESADIAAIANRYLLFLLPPETLLPASGSTFEASARELHNRVIEAARKVAAGKLAGPELSEALGVLRESFKELLERPERKESGLDALLGDINMDLLHVQNAGKAPSSVRLARELRN